MRDRAPPSSMGLGWLHEWAVARGSRTRWITRRSTPRAPLTSHAPPGALDVSTTTCAPDTRWRAVYTSTSWRPYHVRPRATSAPAVPGASRAVVVMGAEARASPATDSATPAALRVRAVSA